jgi:hypothetical protein
MSNSGLSSSLFRPASTSRSIHGETSKLGRLETGIDANNLKGMTNLNLQGGEVLLVSFKFAV